MTFADLPHEPGGYFSHRQAPKLVQYLNAQTPFQRLNTLVALPQYGVTEPLLESLLRARAADGQPLLRDLASVYGLDAVMSALIRSREALCDRIMPPEALNYERLGQYLWRRGSVEGRERLTNHAFESRCFSPFMLERALAAIEQKLAGQPGIMSLASLNDAMRKWPDQMFWLGRRLSPRLRDGLAHGYVRRLDQGWRPVQAGLVAAMGPTLARYLLRAA